jgi:RNA polymerase sigma-70 factor (ECF subfamily)
MATFLTTPVPHTDGAAFIRNKPVVTRAIFDALAPDLQARAFLITEDSAAQRLVRAKAKIRGARIPFEVPAAGVLAERLAGVLGTVYLIFNEGHASMAAGLADEAIRLARLLHQLMPEPEVAGLLALLHKGVAPARRLTRSRV